MLIIILHGDLLNRTCKNTVLAVASCLRTNEQFNIRSLLW